MDGIWMNNGWNMNDLKTMYLPQGSEGFWGLPECGIWRRAPGFQNAETNYYHIFDIIS